MNKHKLLKTLLVFFILCSVIIPIGVNAATPPTYAECTGPINSRPEGCKPPSLGDFQTTLVSLIGTAYSMVGLLFMGILLYNGLIYLIGYLEDAKYILGASIEDVQKRMTQWLVGFLMVLLSYPLINGFMKLIVGDSSCYEKLNNPTVQFIFPSVCNITDPVKDAASCTSIGSKISGGINAWCTTQCNTLTTTPKPKLWKFSYSTTGIQNDKFIWCSCSDAAPSCWAVTIYTVII
jgi:hypothetical protein